MHSLSSSSVDESDASRVARLEFENRELRARLHEFTVAAGRNDALMRKTADREVELLSAESLGDLLTMLVEGLRESYQLESVGLLLHDPQHEIRQLVAREPLPRPVRASLRFVDVLAALSPHLAGLDRPWLGGYDEFEHEALFAHAAAPRSVAVIPLARADRLDGVLAFGSADPERFTPALASDFLAHLGIIASICVENAVNRARLIRAGVTDFLTGWHNRRYFESRLVEELARAQRAGQPVGCVLFDVDHFKTLNDRHGHPAGDRALQEVAARVALHVRSSDTAARFGGDEFAILLPGARADEALRLAERILASVTAEPVPLRAGIEGEVTLSIGVASVVPQRDDRDYRTLADALLAEADAALYRAKALGRNRVALSSH